MAGFTCDIVTPAAKLFSGEAYMVTVPGVEGDMGFLPGHMPLVSALADGKVGIQSQQGSAEKQLFAVRGGYVQVSGEKVIVLADAAVKVEDIDKDAVTAQMRAFQEQAKALSAEELAKTTLESDIAWCQTQLNAVAR